MNRFRAIPSAVAWVPIVAALTAVNPRSAYAQTVPPSGGEAQAPSAQELAKKLVNPLTDLVSVPLQFNWTNGIGPEKETRTLVYFQPVVPMSLNEDWNLIGRLVMPYLSQPLAVGGSSGLSDIIAQAFFSPKTSGTFTWGAGPMLYMPATTDPTLGYGKWSGGPVVAVMKQTSGGLTFGMLWNNIWSFAEAGEMERADVNLGYFQPVVAYSSRGGVTLTFSTEAIADWNAPDADRWSIPVNLLVSKLTRFANTPMSVQVGGGYYVAKPTHGPDWQLRTTFTLLFPRRR